MRTPRSTTAQPKGARPHPGSAALSDEPEVTQVESHHATGGAGVRTRSQHQRRKRIIQAAAALASRGGVEAMQMRTVAERAGVALGTLYRYFPSKMDLVVAVVSEELDLLEESIARRPPGSTTPAGRAVDVLMRATRSLMREPELADALIRSLIMAEVEAPFGDRVTGLLLRVAAGGLTTEDATEEQVAVAGSLAGIWVCELLEMLRGRRTHDQVQSRIEIAAARLLIDF
ncbi:DNA-binding transcriptional regulator, AcrR family [Sinosporangium album]|uniref:DNA-binding transcriptional regulator, AcrR family n=1 Tax=Sinosporangium album TaxID=504805 RepID=A0A1G8F3D2_9ACTN|nr:DNA-binding transcriptional regulator, AcrR family [Sinosporangium album]